jgi:hypothetical protein
MRHQKIGAQCDGVALSLPDLHPCDPSFCNPGKKRRPVSQKTFDLRSPVETPAANGQPTGHGLAIFGAKATRPGAVCRISQLARRVLLKSHRRDWFEGCGKGAAESVATGGSTADFAVSGSELLR